MGKLQQTKSILAKQQQLHSTSGQVEHLHSILGNFKQLHSKLNNIQPLNLNLHAFRNIWAKSNSLDRIWVIERASFKRGQPTIRTIWANWKSVIHICTYIYLRKLQQPKSKLDQLKQLYSNLGRVRNILKLGTCSGNSPFQLTAIFVNLKLLML